MSNSFSDFVAGYAGLAPIFGTTADTLRVQVQRGRFTLKPVSRVGNTLLFDRQAALRYAEVYNQRRRKRKA